jgi:hypothetical protein
MKMLYRLLRLAESEKGPLSMQEISLKLGVPMERLQGELINLLKSGVVREVSLEQLLDEEK